MNCPLCNHDCSGALETRVFGPQLVPALNNTVYPTRDQALAAESGMVDIVACPACDLVFNRAFDPTIARYDTAYDASRHNSPYYNRHQSDLVEVLSKKLDESSQVLEVGCGDCFFLKSICDRAKCRGTGIDPCMTDAAINDRIALAPHIDSLPDEQKFSMLILQHVLEHISNPLHFLKNLGEIRLDPGAPVFIEVPALEWILENGMWFDFTHEHINYFTASTISNLTRAAGFEVEQVSEGYEGQYLLVHARYTGHPVSQPPEASGSDYSSKAEQKKDALLQLVRHEERFAIWGASGKGVLFLSGLPRDVLQKVNFAVDINPAKQNKFLPVSGVRVAHPEELQDVQSLVFIMNPAYQTEILGMMKSMNINSNVCTVP